MSELGAEGLATEVIGYLTTHLASHLTTVNARFSESITLEDVGEWRYDDPVSGRLPNLLPGGWVVVPTLVVDQWGDDYDSFTSDVIVWILIQDSITEQLKKKIYRTIQAVWECLKAGHFDNTISWSIIEDPRFDYAEIMTGANGILLSDARIRLKMYSQERS